MRIALAFAFACLLSACAVPRNPTELHPSIAAEINAAAAAKPQPAREAAIDNALLPPLRLELPKVDARALEQRFDLSVNNAPATQVLLSIVSGTRYSMLVHPDVTGTISVNVKDVTVREALEALRVLYGYEYRIEGNNIFVQAPSMQTRVFRVNYLAHQRVGRSELRVISGSVADVEDQSGQNGQGGNNNRGNNSGAPGQPSRATDSSRIVTSTQSDFWRDLAESLRIVVGAEGGRSVVVNPQAGVIVVRGMPSDMRNVAEYLQAIKLSVERQIMLEAKILEVTLSDSFQSGVNWAAFGSNLTAGVVRPGTRLGTSGNLISPRITSNPGSDIVTRTTTTAAGLLPNVPGGSLFGLAFQTSSFAALLEFLEGQGSVQVLSSPRIAALNNQKAVLKVGTDEFFITSIQSGSTSSNNNGDSDGSNTFPTLTLQPFFSGVALDITPQIDEGSNVILHIHPSVSNVTQDDRTINLGEVFGQVNLPLARSQVSETDSVVKVSDNNIVAIGGLMKVDLADRKSGLPGAQDIPLLGNLFGSRDRLVVKKELVILIKPTIIGGETDTADLNRARERILELGGSRASYGQ